MSRLSRRDFAKTTLIAAVAGHVDAQETAPATPPASAEAEARVASVMGRFGSRFSEQQKKEIRERITGIQSGLEAMRAYPLDNAVEPATLFRVYRAPSRERRIQPHER